MNMSVKSDQIHNATIEALASSPKGKGEEEAVVDGEIFSVILDETSSPVEQETDDVIPAEQDISEEDVVAAMLADDALALLLEDVPEDDLEVASDELVDQVLAESAAMNIDMSEIDVDEEAPETDEAPEEVDLVNLVNLAQTVEEVRPQTSEIKIAVDQTTHEIPEIVAQAAKNAPVAQPLDDKPEEAAEKVQAPEEIEDGDAHSDVTVAEVEIPEGEDVQPVVVDTKPIVDRKNIPEATAKKDKDDVNPIDAFDSVRDSSSQMSESRGKESRETRNFNPVVDAAHAIDAELQKSPETRVSGRDMDVVTAAHDMGARISSSKMGAAEIDPANHYQAAESRPLNEDHFVDNIVRHCRVLTRPDGSSEMRLRLDPPELGAMTLRLTLKDDHLIAHVELDGDIRESVENLIPRIRESLAADGLTLDRVDIESRRQPESQNSGNADGARDQESREGREFSRVEEQPKEHRRRVSIRTSEGVMDFTV